jgi:hypothetical protein
LPISLSRLLLRLSWLAVVRRRRRRRRGVLCAMCVCPAPVRGHRSCRRRQKKVSLQLRPTLLVVFCEMYLSASALMSVGPCRPGRRVQHQPASQPASQPAKAAAAAAQKENVSFLRLFFPSPPAAAVTQSRQAVCMVWNKADYEFCKQRHSNWPAAGGHGEFSFQCHSGLKKKSVLTPLQAA